MAVLSKSYISFLLIALVACSAVAQKVNSRSQREFGAEIDIDRPKKVSDDILNQVLGNGGELYVDESPLQFRKRIVGTLIDLDGDTNRDFLVQGDDGANVSGFWLFRNTNGRMRLVLHVRALGLSLGPKTSRGVREVVAGAASASKYWGAKYVFSRGRYRPIKCWEEELIDDEATRKKRYFPCREGSLPYWGT